LRSNFQPNYQLSLSDAENSTSLLKNSLEAVFRARKGSASSVADQEPYLERGIQRAINRLRKDKKNQKLKELHERRRPLGVQERETPSRELCKDQ
jgi:hypothetical protein